MGCRVSGGNEISTHISSKDQNVFVGRREKLWLLHFAWGPGSKSFPSVLAGFQPAQPTFSFHTRSGGKGRCTKLH